MDRFIYTIDRKELMKLSILIPAYNVERYITRCLDSILSQISANDLVEVLIVNDGSTDSTALLLDAYDAKYEQVKVYHKKNEGVGAVRNKLLEWAEGDYIWFLDADDYIEQGCISDITKRLEQNPALELLHLSYRTFDDSSFGRWENYYNPIFIGDGEDYLLKGKPNTYLWSKVYKREIIQKHQIRFRDDIYSQEDWLFNMHLFPMIKNMEESNIKAYNYYTGNANSVLHTRDVKIGRASCRERVYGLV